MKLKYIPEHARRDGGDRTDGQLRRLGIAGLLVGAPERAASAAVAGRHADRWDVGAPPVGGVGRHGGPGDGKPAAGIVGRALEGRADFGSAQASVRYGQIIIALFDPGKALL